MRKYFTSLFVCLPLIFSCGSPNSSNNKDDNNTSITYLTTLEQALPAYSPQEQIIRHFAYTLKYNSKHKLAAWVAYRLTKDELSGNVARTNDFRVDPSVTNGIVTLEDYKASGYDRGHLAPAADMRWSEQAMSESFYLSNITPQKPEFNQGIWETLESCVRTWAYENEDIYIVTGPVLVNGLSTIGYSAISVPLYYYKVVLDCKGPELKAIGFVIPNSSTFTTLPHYSLSVDSVESLTGIDFFPGLVNSQEVSIESKVDISKWSFNEFDFLKKL
jgi:endonuclease G, mitochondrial